MFEENNKHRQKKLISFLNNLPQSVQKIIKKSWAKPFYEHIFCKIDESRFKVLYSEKGSRPNKPANLLIGLEIIKQLFNYTDDELVELFHTDLRTMYALGLTDPGEVSIAIRTIYYFREHLIDYDVKHNTSLLKEVLKDISLDLSKEFKLDLHLQRMDSSMIEANIKRLTRLNLFVKVIYNFLKILNSTDISSLPREIQLLLKEKNLDLSHRLKDNESKAKIEEVGKYAYLLYEKYKDNINYNKSKQFEHLKRLVEEHLNIHSGNNSSGVSLKPLKDIPSSSLQNPSDPDVTYRKKSGTHQGYVGNFSETFSKDNDFQVITDVEVAPNNTLDTNLLIKSLSDDNSLVKEAKTLLADGGYSGEETKEECLRSGIELHVSGIKGPREVKRHQNLAKVIIENGVLIKCPAGKSPYKQKYDKEKKYFSGRFKNEVCSKCPFVSECFVSNRKNFYSYGFDKREYEVKRQKEKLKDPEYKKFLNHRAGVESLVYMFFFKTGKRTKFRGLSRVKNPIIYRAIGINLLRLFNHIKKRAAAKELSAGFSLFSTYIVQKSHFLLKHFQNLKITFQKNVFNLKYELFAL